VVNAVKVDTDVVTVVVGITIIELITDVDTDVVVEFSNINKVEN
jgi:hypothetical protein